MGSIKSGALPQREMAILKSEGAAAARNGQYKKRRRCRNENRSIKEAGALPQREMGSIKSGALPQQKFGTLKSEGAAATRDRHFKKRGRCRNEKWAV